MAFANWERRYAALSRISRPPIWESHDIPQYQTARDAEMRWPSPAYVMDCKR